MNKTIKVLEDLLRQQKIFIEHDPDDDEYRAMVKEHIEALTHAISILKRIEVEGIEKAVSNVTPNILFSGYYKAIAKAIVAYLKEKP